MPQREECSTCRTNRTSSIGHWARSIGPSSLPSSLTLCYGPKGEELDLEPVVLRLRAGLGLLLLRDRAQADKASELDVDTKMVVAMS